MKERARAGLTLKDIHYPKKSSVVIARELVVLSETLGTFHVIRQGGGCKIHSFLGLLVPIGSICALNAFGEARCGFRV